MNIKLVRKRLIDKNMTQGDLARELNISQACLSKKMNGKTEFKLSELSNICRLLEVDITELISEEQE